MIKQAFVLLTVTTVCLALGDGKAQYSKKNTFKAPSQYASVASFHSTKQAQPQSAPQQTQHSYSQPAQPQSAPQQTQHSYSQPAQPERFQSRPEPQRAPSPYAFSYDADGSARQESSDASGKVSGSYKVTNEDGSIRVVNYVADENGFRADIDTNEPGTKSDNPAHVTLKSAAVEKKYEAPSKYAAQSFAQKTTKTRYEQKPIQYDSGRNTGAYSYNHVSSQQQPIQQAQFSDSKPAPYAFSYDAQLDDGSSSRTESADASGKVVGSYSLAAADGRKRVIKYEADHEGFRAVVDTNEFGTKSDSPANVDFQSSAPLEAPASQMYAGSRQKSAPATSYPVQQQLSAGGIKSASQAPVMYQGQSSVQYGSPVQEKYAPYSFNYAADLDDGSISRKEYADESGKVVGSYSLSVADGRQRTVDYLADKEGFRATVNTNEFGTKADSPADVQFYSSATFDEPAPYSSPNTYKASSSSASMYSSSAVQQQPIQAPIQFNMGNGNGAYSYNYQAALEDGGNSARSESSEGSGKVSGYYSMSIPDGRMRKVDYTADVAGFQASVDTNEFGTKSDSPAHVSFLSSAPQVAPEAPRAPVAFKAPSAPQAAGSADMYKTSYVSQQRVEPVQSFQPSPYAFDYNAEATGGSSSRKESSDANGVVTGSYEVRNEDGSLRVVDYIADHNGFRANVKTNEPGTKSDRPADVVVVSNAPAAPLQQKPYSAPSAPLEQKAVKADFPARTFTQKSSMISQRSIDEWSR